MAPLPGHEAIFRSIENYDNPWQQPRTTRDKWAGRALRESRLLSKVKDAALIAAAQKCEHYEIAGYGSARTFAQNLGYTQAVDMLQQILDQEGETDKLLTALATGQGSPVAINEQATR